MEDLKTLKTDLVAAKLVLDSVNDFLAVEKYTEYASQKKSSIKSTLESIWEGPRISPETYGHNRALSFYWSLEARDLFFGKACTKDELVRDHIFPTALKVKELIFNVREGNIKRPKEMLEWLLKSYSGKTFVIITASENARIEKKWRSSIPESGDPFDRYRESGIEVKNFRSLESDPRFKENLGERKITKSAKRRKIQGL